MTGISITQIKNKKNRSTYLLIASVILTALYLYFSWTIHSVQSLVSNCIFLSAIGVSLYDKRSDIRLKTDIVSSLTGSFLIATFCLQNYFLPVNSISLPIFFLIAAIGLGFLASGIKGIKLYWQEFSLILALAIPGGNFFIWWLKIAWVNYLVRSSQIWLLSVAVVSTGVYLYILHTTQLARVLYSNLIALVPVFWLMWQKRDKLCLRYQLYPSLLGTASIAFAVSKISGDAGVWLETIPFFVLLGIVLIASGFSAFKAYRQELIILAVVALFGALKDPIEQNFALSTITAQFSHFLLPMWGIESVRQGEFIIFSQEVAVHVNKGCAGYRQIFWLLELAVLYVVLFPCNRINTVVVPTFAVLIGLIVNVIRVTILCILVAGGDIDGYHYWHLGDGSRIFTIIPVFIFGLLCFHLTKQINIRTPTPSLHNQSTRDY